MELSEQESKKILENLFPDLINEKIDDAEKNIDLLFTDNKDDNIFLEMKELNKKILDLKKKLACTKNVKNHRLTAVNKKRSEQRALLKQEISTLSDKYEMLKLEYEGSKK